MLTALHLKNFKAWEKATLQLAPLTGFFGTNSSGKTALLQALLLLKQTVASLDRSRPIHFGDDRSFVDLGTFHDVIFKHDETRSLGLYIAWQLDTPLKIKNPTTRKPLLTTKHLTFETEIANSNEGPKVTHFAYKASETFRFGMQADNGKYKLDIEGYKPKRQPERPWPLPPPIKCYGFPDEVYTFYQNVGFLSKFVFAFEHQMSNVYYLGPLREYPRRIYVWAGDQPESVGQRGELAIHALLAAERKGIKVNTGPRRRKKTVTERVAQWLKDLELIHSFSVKPLGEHRKEYEVHVQRYRHSPEVSLTDVGFGVSQILPVLTLCYYAPKGSTIILEQPEIHLHPSVQAGLADVFIDAIQNHQVQIILESHSEHLLRRLQRRIAEEKISATDVALYFVKSEQNGVSHAEPLDVDEYGFIKNWPDQFFGDEMGELVAMNEAALKRQQLNTGNA